MQLTKQEIDYLKYSFDMFDVDSNNSITPVELGWGLKKLTGSKFEIHILHQIIHSIDADGDGEICFDEFVNLVQDSLTSMYKNPQHEQQAELQRAFQVFDNDNDGLLTKSELRVGMKNIGIELTAEEIDALINEADQDQDGNISFEEFQKVMGQ